MPETAWLMRNLFCKWSQSKALFSLRSCFNILFLWVSDLLLNHWSNFLMPFEYPASSIERKREYYGMPTTSDFSWFCFQWCYFMCLDFKSPVRRGLAEQSWLFIAAAPLLPGAVGGCGPSPSRAAGCVPPESPSRASGAGCRSRARRGNETFSVTYPSFCREGRWCNSTTGLLPGPGNEGTTFFVVADWRLNKRSLKNDLSYIV